MPERSVITFSVSREYGLLSESAAYILYMLAVFLIFQCSIFYTGSMCCLMLLSADGVSCDVLPIIPRVVIVALSE